jgi:3-phosphoshikimate 1-carboxyvinyltransferase
MITIVKPLQNKKLNGNLTAPSSKSMMQRVVAAALLCDGVTNISNASFCDDSLAAIEIVGNLGGRINIDRENKKVKIVGSGKIEPKTTLLNTNEAGLSIRMFTPITALSEKEISLTGRGSLLKRPVSMMEKPLENLGVSFESNEGFLPIKVKGPINGGKAFVDGSVSSQFLTGLLFALPKSLKDTILEVESLKSKPYIDMTINVLNEFGIEIENSDYERFIIKGNQNYKGCDYTVEGDWSGGAFLLAAGAVGGRNVKIDLLDKNSTQADRAFLDVLKLSGAKFDAGDSSIVFNSDEQTLNGFEFDATECPDLFPPIVSLAAYCKGVSVIKGVNRLKHKESDRGEVLKNEFSKLGIRIEISGDIMKIHGTDRISGGEIDSHNDHRIAMAATVMAIGAEAPVTIKNSECINKSYNDFYDDMKKIGMEISS